ncbi:hypothetical protein DFH06DRAFT_1317123 [Mycena polygramma]|nr:hypothetical protein DFH06DRAFT_1317123 [Mycena polygramma]
MYMHTRSGKRRGLSSSASQPAATQFAGASTSTSSGRGIGSLAEREKICPYQRGETSTRPGPDDHVDSDSGESEIEVDVDPASSDGPTGEEELGSNDSMSQSDEKRRTLGRFPLRRGPPKSSPSRSSSTRGAWTLHSIRPFSPYDLRPRRLTRVPTPLIDNKAKIGGHSSIPDRRYRLAQHCAFGDRVGVEYGGARGLKPQNVQHQLANASRRADLAKPRRSRIAAWHNTIHHSFAPRLYNYTEHATDLIFKYDPNLRREFEGIFPAAEFDLGSSVPRPACKTGICFKAGVPSLLLLGTYNARRRRHRPVG